MNIKDLNNNFDSVNSYWDAQLNSPIDSGIKVVNKVCSDEYKNRLEQKFDTTEYYFDSAYIPFEYSLLLNLYNRDNSWIEYYNAMVRKISSKVRNYLRYHDNQSNDDSAKLYHASKTLNGFVILASIEEFKTPSIPMKEILLEGLSPFINRLESSKSKIPLEEKESCILASVMAILADEFDLSNKFLSYCKNFKDVKRHYSVLNQITKASLSENKLSELKKVETAFFEIFNLYRLPIVRGKRKALEEYPIIDNLVSNYLFAWLYLKIFKNQTKSTWEEMRIIMMG